MTYAEYGGVDRRRILTAYVMRNALAPQVTGLAMSLGAIFNGRPPNKRLQPRAAGAILSRRG